MEYNEVCTADYMCVQGYSFVCVSGRCLCDTNPRVFWSSDHNKCITCPVGWDITNGRCYRKYTTALTWSAAKTACIAQGGYLLISNNQNEFNNLLNYFSGSDFWVRNFFNRSLKNI